MNELSMSMRKMVVETLGLLASRDKQREYQQGASHVDVPAELFNQWDDCYFPDDIQFQRGFSDSELEALAHFGGVMDQICNDTPRVLPPLEEFLTTEAWRRLSVAADAALSKIESNVTKN